MLLTPNKQPFATGMAKYDYRPVSEQSDNNRLFLRVELEDLPLLAVVDTGASYVVLEPALANLLGLDPANALENRKLKIRGVVYSGRIHRLPLQFVATEGDSLLIEATVFIPDTDEVGWGDLPSFLGMTGCLERLRFAVDPQADAFYFGAL